MLQRVASFASARVMMLHSAIFTSTGRSSLLNPLVSGVSLGIVFQGGDAVDPRTVEMEAAVQHGPGGSSAVLLIDREMLWRKLFAFDQELHASVSMALGRSGAMATDADSMRRSIQRLVERGRHGPLRAMLQQRICYWIRSDITEPFWRFFEHAVELMNDARRSKRRRHELTFFCAEQLTMAMQFAEDAFSQCVENASVMDSAPHVASADEVLHGVRGIRRDETMLDQLRASFRSILFEDNDRKTIFQDVLVIFYSMSFHKFCGREKFQAFDSRPIQALLLQLDWMHVAEPALLRVLHSQIHKTMETVCGDDYTERYLQQLEEWAAIELLPWLDDLLRTSDDSHDAIRRRWSEILSSHVIQEFGKWRTSQLFDIIKEYPDSTPALEDIAACLERTTQHLDLVANFRDVIITRLLHPGATTSAILDIYVSTIKAFRILDARGVLLEGLSEPVKEYLKQRKDTVRCIVMSLTDEQHGELFEELRKNNMRVIQQDDDSDDDEDISPDLWEPDPVEADPTKTSRSRNSDDILRILVNIYGSRELFVNEYRMMLADKLLQNTSFNTDRDVQTLELLKLRFGEDSLQHCEIMVRDIDESKRVNQNISSTENAKNEGSGTAFFTNATIISSQFWPPLQNEEFVLHPLVASQVNRYRRAYEVLKNPRKLAWNNSLGSVLLTIELEGVERDFSVSPIQATIIQHFDCQDLWIVEDLAAQLENSDEQLIKHATYWLNHGVLRLSATRKELIAATSFDEARFGVDGPPDEMDTAVSSEAQEEEDVRVLETYIVGMLSNFGSLPIQRIHNTLSTFARSGAQPYDKTISGLTVILSKLVDKGKLELVGGQYQLAK